jgi:enoyl-CoA hydratase/carnithine racemase
MSVRLEIIEPGIAHLQVDRRRVRNALNWQAMHAFAECVEQAHALPGLRALILSGAGGSFIAGGDLRELHGLPSRHEGQRLAQWMSAALERLEALPCPTIAAINGTARRGVEIARLATARAGGVMPAWGWCRSRWG